MIIISSFVLFLIVFKEWFFGSGILTSGDWVYFFAEKQSEFLTFPNIWSASGLGGVDLGLTMYPVLLLYGILSKIGFGFSERIIYFAPSIIMAFFGSYFLLRLYFKNKYALIIGVSVFTLNTYFMTARTGHMTLMASFALAPTAFYFFRKFVQSKKISYLLLSILVSTIASYYEFRAFYLIALVILLMGFYSFYFTRQISARNLFKTFVAYFGGIGLANIFWILPFQMTNFFSINEVTGRALFGSSFMRIDRAFGLFHPFWSGGKMIAFEVQKMPVYMWIIPISAVLGLYVYRKKPSILLFGLIALVGIFLTKQSNQPFSSVYGWLYDHFPGFSAFREASKFYFFIALGYSVLIAAFVDWLISQNYLNKIARVGKYIIPIILAVIFLWNTKPIISDEIGTLFVPRKIPQDYITLKDKIVVQKDFFRTLWIPRLSRWSIYTNNHPSLSQVETKFTCPEISKCTNILDNDISAEILDLYSIKYVIVPIQDYANDDDFFVHYGNSREHYIDELSKLTYLKRIYVGNGDLAIFENSHYKPHIYLSTSQTKYISINPTQYNLTLNRASDPITLNFTDSYHPDWKLRIGEFNWLQSLIQKDYFYPEKYHSRSDVGLNQWEIDPRWLDRHGITDKAIPVTIYFASQSWAYIGGIISATTLISLSVILIYFMIHEHKKNTSN